MTALAAINPLAPPALFSTTTGYPRAADILSMRSCAMISGGPPGGDDTTSLTGRSGKACAPWKSDSCTMHASREVTIFCFMVFPWDVPCPLRAIQIDVGSGPQYCTRKLMPKNSINRVGNSATKITRSQVLARYVSGNSSRYLGRLRQDCPSTCARTGTLIVPISGLSTVIMSPGFTGPTPLVVPL